MKAVIFFTSYYKRGRKIDKMFLRLLYLIWDFMQAKGFCCLTFITMDEKEDFFIDYKNKQLKVSAMRNEGKIYFIVHLKKPITIVEGMLNEEWVWYEVGQGETLLAEELGKLIEDMDG